MAANRYDAIVVGARCAGAPTAMLLARRGYRVLLVDRATFPSDTVSTHLIHPPGIAALRRWGLLDALVATGCPPIESYLFDFGAFAISGVAGVGDDAVAYAPRRTVLDKLLVDAAAASGVEVREGFTVEDVVVEGDRVVGIRGHGKGDSPGTEHARVVVGADGRHSHVARAVRPRRYHEKPPLLMSYYTYWSGLPVRRFQTYVRPYRGFAAWPTHDDLTLVIAGWPYVEFAAHRDDVEGTYLETLGLVSEFATLLGEAKREDRFVGTAVENYFRRPFGTGWALVGDAGYNKDFITAQGIQDAFRDAELCSSALDQWLSGSRPFDAALGDYQSARDSKVLPMYELTCELATLEPPPPDLQQLLWAVHVNQESMDAFVRVNAGVTSPAEFFAAENVARIFASAGDQMSA
jgi:2-polyprenyl-6-methoxyphenol hydroxylase-like FAD-dependent oxidoreductase